MTQPEAEVVAAVVHGAFLLAAVAWAAAEMREPKKGAAGEDGDPADWWKRGGLN